MEYREEEIDGELIIPDPPPGSMLAAFDEFHRELHAVAEAVKEAALRDMSKIAAVIRAVRDTLPSFRSNYTRAKRYPVKHQKVHIPICDMVVFPTDEMGTFSILRATGRCNDCERDNISVLEFSHSGWPNNCLMCQDCLNKMFEEYDDN